MDLADTTTNLTFHPSLFSDLTVPLDSPPNSGGSAAGAAAAVGAIPRVSSSPAIFAHFGSGQFSEPVTPTGYTFPVPSPLSPGERNTPSLKYPTPSP
jgi:hypothetical protein